MTQSNQSDSSLVATRNFLTYSTLGILLVLLLAQSLYIVFKVKIIPEIISIGVTFICVFYLWLVERKDMETLEKLNLELLRTQEMLRTNQVDTVLSLVLSQKAKDSYTYGHCERVKRYSILIAQKLGLSKEEMEVIGRGAKLHDIGKIGIEDEILFKAEDLTQEESEVIKSHTIKGVKILEPLKFLDQEKLIVRHHHERYDGKGYPDKLKGEEIPLGARIISVANTFDILKSEGLNKKHLTKEEITLQMTLNAGTQFDPKVVEAFIAVIDSFDV